MNTLIETKQRSWLHARTPKPWLFSLAYSTFLIYLVFLTPGRSDLGDAARIIHIVPFENSLKAMETLSENHSEFFVYSFLFANLLGNVLLFVPLPVMLLHCFNIRRRWAIIAAAASLSLGIEALQYCFEIGIADIDDLICNSTGAVTGAYLHSVLPRYRRDLNSK